MANPTTTVNICQYRIHPGNEAEMEALLARHWPTLHRAGLVTDEPAKVYRGRPSTDGDPHGAAGVYFEIFSWRTPEAPALAHENPEVMAVWEPMGELCASMDFPSFDILDL